MAVSGGVVPGPGGVYLVPGGYLVPGDVPSPGGCTWSRGVYLAQGVYLAGGVPGQVPPPCGQTDACKNITFATSLRTVKIITPMEPRHFHEGLDWISDPEEDIWQVQLLNCNTPIYPGYLTISCLVSLRSMCSNGSSHMLNSQTFLLSSDVLIIVSLKIVGGGIQLPLPMSNQKIKNDNKLSRLR